MSTFRFTGVGVGCLLLGVVWVFGQLSAQNRDRAAPVADMPGDVRQFGAVGDGRTDDTAAIQRAVDSPLGHVRFNSGIYRVSRPIVIDLDRGGSPWITASGPTRLVMAGPGPALKFISAADASKPEQPQAAEPTRQLGTPVVDGLEIAGDHAEASGILVSGTTQLRIKGVDIHDVNHAIHLVARNRNVSISDCRLWRNRGTGILLDQTNLRGLNVTDCHIDTNAGGGIVLHGGRVRNVQISTSAITANAGAEGSDSANILLDSAGGSIANVAVIGCTIQFDRRIPNSANIRVQGLGTINRSGKEIEYNFGHITITGNLISDGDINIDIRSARGIIVIGNTLWLGYQHNLRLEESLDIVLGLNLLDRNPAFERETVASNSVVFRRCRDCTINGLHLHETHNSAAALLVESCNRFNITTCTILDCDGIGISLQKVVDSTLSDSVVRDDRDPRNRSITIHSKGGGGNMIVDNMMVGPDKIELSTNHTSGNFGGYRN